MAETTTTANPTPKSKKPVASAAAPSFEAPKFEMPKFDIPKFEIPTMEVPGAFREFAEKSVAQAKESYEKVKSAAEQATDVLEETYSAASKGYCDYGLKVIETARTNSNAAFDLYGDLLKAKSYAELVELTTTYVREQFETSTAQIKELTEQAQKCAAAASEPMKESFASFTKAS